jgi:hypothetical protein
MNTNDSIHDRLPDAGWQILGELELPVGVHVEEALQVWLTEIANSLNLQADLLTKIIRSAQDAALRAIHSMAALQFEHIHLLVLIPSDPARAERNWSFFRVEKIEDTDTGDPGTFDHAIELYLYGEGD